MAANTADPGLPPEKLSFAHHTWRTRILISTYFAYAGYYLTRKVFTICKTTIAVEWGMSLQDMAHIWTAYLLAYMIGQFVNSFLGRKFGPRVLLLGGLGLSMAFNIVFGITNSYYTFLVFMFFNGLVQASGWPGVVGGIAEWLRPKERGSIMGFWSTSYLIGNLLVKSMGSFLLGEWGWRWSFFGCTLLTAFIWLLIFFWQRNKPQDVGLSQLVPDDNEEGRAIAATQAERVSFREYLNLAANPIVLAMGASYFCIKFLRYALDSWLPAFLDIQGMSAEQAGYYSSIFDWAGLGGAIAAGFALDWIFRGKWPLLCLTMGIGMVAGYVVVILYGGNPYALAFSFGLVGFMIYGPDTILCGAASITVAGERNGVAMAGLVNGIGSIGPIIQEEVIGLLVRDDVHAGIRNTNLLGLAMSIVFVLLMLIVMWRVRIGHRQLDEARTP
jgi:sugar phosphate permease